VIIPDINLLLYASIEAFPEHQAARKWWASCLEGKVEIGIVDPVLFGFIRIATNRRIFEPPMTVGAATNLVQGWLARPNVRTVVPGPRHLQIAFDLLNSLGSAGNLTTDIQIAAFALENQAEVHSADVDFARFSGLRWSNPLTQGK